MQNLSETIWHVLDKTSELNSARLKTEVRPPIRVWFACVATRNAFEVAVEKFLHVRAVILMKLELFSRTLNSYEQTSIIFKHFRDWKSNVQTKITVIEKFRRTDVCKWKKPPNKKKSRAPFCSAQFRKGMVQWCSVRDLFKQIALQPKNKSINWINWMIQYKKGNSWQFKRTNR